MALCPKDGRHCRLFINDREYVDAVLARLEGQTPAADTPKDSQHGKAAQRRAKTILERGTP